MEPKKVKKLALNKETISNLSNFEQSRIIGGHDAEGVSRVWWNTICYFISAFGLPEYSCRYGDTDCPGDYECWGPSHDCGRTYDFASSCNTWTDRPLLDSCNC